MKLFLQERLNVKLSSLHLGRNFPDSPNNAQLGHYGYVA